MKAIPYDMCRCVPTAFDCDRKEQCARYTSPHREDGWQTFADLSPYKDKCGDFIDNEMDKQ